MPASESTSALLVYITAADREQALAIARALVAERLAACVNVLGAITAVYRWDGAVQEDTEVALLAKTTPGSLDALTTRVKALHTYQCPCVIAWVAGDGNKEFLRWIEREVADCGE